MKKLIFIILILCTSCLGTKKISEKTSDKSLVEKSEKKHDSIAKETVNKGIDDSATFKVAQSNTGDTDFDKRVNEAVANILRNINLQKTSGDNSYQLYYNERLNQLEAQIKVGETKNSEVNTNKENTSQKETSEKTTNSFKKYASMMPWWLWVVGFFVFFRQIMGVVSIVYPPARGITSIQDLFHPPKKD